MIHHCGYVNAVLAALLFGINSTLNKIALRKVHPILIVGSIYLTEGIVLVLPLPYITKDKILEKPEFKVKTREHLSRRDLLL